MLPEHQSHLKTGNGKEMNYRQGRKIDEVSKFPTLLSERMHKVDAQLDGCEFTISKIASDCNIRVDAKVLAYHLLETFASTS